MSWERLAEVFCAALELPAERRSAWIGGACADEAMRSEVEAMVRAHELAEREPLAIEEWFREAVDAATGAAVDRSRERVGPYRLLRLLGRGGMGEVYLAERADGQYEGAVAIKLLSAGLAGPEREARLRRERQILASLRHPGIAQLHDGGVTAGNQPFLVMEHVDGEPIDRWCDRQRLSVDERLGLFARVCDAVQYAHGRLVVHRDIKPSNVLVDAAGTPKLLDFGIAKLLDSGALGSAEGSAEATHAEQRLFTPLRAAPEQVRGEPVSTATDVYGLGVLLFELLTGALPFRTASSDSWEAQRAVCEADPRRPSAALGDSAADASAPTLDAVCAARRSTAAGLRRRLRGDLESVLARCLAKVPEQRYPSAGALAEDVRRFLRGEPVEARPQTWWYRGGKFARRHLVPVAATGAAVVALAAAGIVAVAQARRAARERDLAVAGERRAQAATDLLVDLFSLADPAAGPAGDEISVSELLARAEERAAAIRDPRLAARLLYDLGRIQRERTDFRVAARLLERARRLAVAARDEPLREDAELQLGMARRGLMELAEARVLLADLVARRRKRLGPQAPATLVAERELARARSPVDAVPALESVLARQRLVLPAGSPELATTLAALGVARLESGDRAGGESAARAALALLEQAGRGSTPQALALLSNLTGAQDDPRRQEELQRRRLEVATSVYGARSVVVATSWNNLGTALALQGRLAEAEAAYATALDLYERRYGRDHAAVANSLRNLGRIRQLQGRPAEALPLLRRALDLTAKHAAAHGPQTRALAGMRMQVARVAWLVERTPQALDETRSAAAAVLALHSHEDDRYRADAVTLLGMTLVEATRACEAVPLLSDALARRGGRAAAGTPGPSLETRCALRDAERACGVGAVNEELAEELERCARDLPRWPLADPELVGRVAPASPGA